MSRRGFSLAEALIAMAIGSLLLMGPAAFCLPLQRHILRQGEQLALEGSRLWQRVHAVGKHLQRAPGTAGDRAAEPGVELAAGGECVRWDARTAGDGASSSGGRQPPADGAGDPARRPGDCRGGGWGEKSPTRPPC